MDKLMLKGYEIIVYPTFVTTIQGYGQSLTIANAGNSIEDCRNTGIRQALNLHLDNSKYPTWLYWNNGEIYNTSAEMVDLLRLRDWIQVIKEDIGHGFTLFTSTDILYAEPSPNTDYYESIYDGAILSYRTDGDCFIQTFKHREVDYKTFLESIPVPPKI